MGKRKRKGKRPRFEAADYRLAEAMTRAAGGDVDAACVRAIEQRDGHLYRARGESIR